MSLRPLRLEEVGRRVGAEMHLEGVSLDIAPGSLTVLLGPIRAGKTSMLRLMAGIDPPTSGRVLLGDVEVHELPPRQRNVGFVHQQFVNYPGKTVYENIAAPLRQRGLGRRELDARVREIAGLLGLESLLERTPDALSGGQQQRTALARAMVREGGLLLLDEPLVNLDYKLREELREELRTIFQRRGATIVYATSDPLEALALGGRTAVLDQGRLLQSGDALGVYRRPESLRVGELTSDPPMNLIAGRVERGRLHVGADAEAPLSGHLTSLHPGPYSFGVRAHRIALERRQPSDVALAGTVELVEIGGSETFLHLRLTEAADTPCVVHTMGVHPRALGERLQIFVDPASVFAFGESGALAAAPES